jgi:hypothetical protein
MQTHENGAGASLEPQLRRSVRAVRVEPTPGVRRLADARADFEGHEIGTGGLTTWAFA